MKNIKTYEEKLNEASPHGRWPDDWQKDLNDDLLLASRTGNTPKVAELLANGASVDAREDKVARSTPLHLATEQHTHTIMEMLLKAGAKPDVLDAMKRTPLHHAAYWGDVDGARILLDAGANTEARDNQDRTPLMRAAADGGRRRNKNLIQYLIVRGADAFTLFSTPEELLEFFDGDIEWVPEPMRLKLKRRIKGKSAFGM